MDSQERQTVSQWADDDEDGLRAARGLLIGIPVGLVMWGVILWLILR